MVEIEVSLLVFRISELMEYTVPIKLAGQDRESSR